jgi:hypothetical protein
MSALTDTLSKNAFSADYNLEVQIRRLLVELLNGNRDDSLPPVLCQAQLTTQSGSGMHRKVRS